MVRLKRIDLRALFLYDAGSMRCPSCNQTYYGLRFCLDDGNPLIETEPPETIEFPTIQVTRITETVEKYESVWTIEYPQLKLGRLERRINRVIRDKFFEEFNEYNDGYLSEVNITYRVTVLTESILSVHQTQKWLGEMLASFAPNYGRGITFDLTSGYIYEKEDLFLQRSDYKFLIPQIVQSQITMKDTYQYLPPEKYEYSLHPSSLEVSRIIRDKKFLTDLVVEDGKEVTVSIPYDVILGTIHPDGPIGRLVCG